MSMCTGKQEDRDATRVQEVVQLGTDCPFLSVHGHVAGHPVVSNGRTLTQLKMLVWCSSGHCLYQLSHEREYKEGRNPFVEGSNADRSSQYDRVMQLCMKDTRSVSCCAWLCLGMRTAPNQCTQALLDEHSHALYDAVKPLCSPFCSMTLSLAACMQ